MAALQFRFSRLTRRYAGAFMVTAVVTVLVSSAITAGVVTAEGAMFVLIGRRHARQRRLAAHARHSA